MPQLRSLIALLLAATAVADVASAAPAPGQPHKGLVVTGRVYCDNCRAGFETTASHNIAGESETADTHCHCH